MQSNSNINFCDFCGNPGRDKNKDTCNDRACYWYSHWQPDMEDPESLKNTAYILGEIRDMNWWD